MEARLVNGDTRTLLGRHGKLWYGNGACRVTVCYSTVYETGIFYFIFVTP